MEQMDNIEAFNRICIILFEKLYSTFPVPAEISMSALALEAVSKEVDYDDAWNVIEVGGEVLKFLEQEGFLTHQGGLLDGSTFYQVRLTMKGLAILGYVPSSLEKQEPIIKRIRNVIGGGLKEAGGETVRQLVSQVFSLALVAVSTVGSR